MQHLAALTRVRLAALAVVGVGLFSAASLPAASSSAPGPPVGSRQAQTATHRHHPPASDFTRGRVDNPWFPLKPGTRYDYRGSEDGARTRDVMIATFHTRLIDGVTCRVVFDRVARRAFRWRDATS